VPLPEHACMVRAGNDNELADVVLDQRVAAIGWAKMRNQGNRICT
jgi:hypothetical protein